MQVGALLLAAGQGSRFGRDKRLASMPDGRSVLTHTLSAIKSAGLPVLACVRPEDPALAELRGINLCRCKCAAEGMGSVLAEGVAVIDHWDAVMIALADMPWVKADTYRQLARYASRSGIRVPTLGGHRGNPVLFGAAFFPLLMQLAGDRGARTVLQSQAGAVREVAVTDPGIFRDVDVPADLRR